MSTDSKLQDLVAAARQDAPPTVDVAEQVVACLAVRRRGPSSRVMAPFAAAASVLAIITLLAAAWMSNHRRDVRMAREELFGQLPSLIASVQP
jgi:hypothetical protein